MTFTNRSDVEFHSCASKKAFDFLKKLCKQIPLTLLTPSIANPNLGHLAVVRCSYPLRLVAYTLDEGVSYLMDVLLLIEHVPLDDDSLAVCGHGRDIQLHRIRNMNFS